MIPFDFITACIGGVLGILIGSFLNVVILRLHTGRGLGGRSKCLSCNRTLSWYELIPLVSFFLQKGKCRTCRTRLSLQYPLVELVTGILFFGATWAITPWLHPLILLLWWVLIATGVIIATYDIRHQVIPQTPLKIFFVISLVLGMHAWGFLLVPLPFLLLWVISRGAWIGFGDVELMACAGILLGLSGGFSAVMLAFWIATLIVIPWVGYRTILKRSFSHAIPFGPFILLGIYLVGIGGLDVFKLITSMLQ